ncbi:hypothetical protein T4B_10333 [Trichinella pseudospiralis]|uniref:Uncharacterized protein n=2 Tax=Trichinella pseudospiralis TaxID=6337 RepID=A0A0V1IMK5_TRIPS|nr:hypothetical protein T4D_1626 [Trichinella pseudospiralis]KRZ23796.1 hypothetical protein T4B_10333 [Trichinella pseudospiralis]
MNLTEIANLNFVTSPSQLILSRRQSFRAVLAATMRFDKINIEKRKKAVLEKNEVCSFEPEHDVTRFLIAC